MLLALVQLTRLGILPFETISWQNPKKAKEYGDLKINCAKMCENDIEKYCDLKNDFIKFHEKKAVQWFKRKEV